MSLEVYERREDVVPRDDSGLVPDDGEGVCSPALTLSLTRRAGDALAIPSALSLPPPSFLKVSSRSLSRSGSEGSQLLRDAALLRPLATSEPAVTR